MLRGAAEAKRKPDNTSSSETLQRSPIRPFPGAADRLLSGTAQALQQCLIEQDRLLAKSPDFLHKGLVTNCTRAALMLFDQLSLCLAQQNRKPG